MKNKLIVLSGPSGVGKGTIVKELLKKGGYALSVSCTTRPKRFLEYNNHFGNFYGTPKTFVEKQLLTYDVILEIEVDGALSVKRSYPDALLIMILPPDENELKARLLKRGSEDGKSIAERLSRMDYEVSKKSEYDFTVINDDLQTAVEEIERIIKSAKK